jgi:hypothetical protein
LKSGSNENLILGYSWLSLASDEIDMKTEAGRLKRQVEYEIKKRNLFDKALEIEAFYRTKYTADAMLEKLRTSHNPLNHILFKFITSIQKIDEYFVKRFKQ